MFSLNSVPLIVRSNQLPLEHYHYTQFSGHNLDSVPGCGLGIILHLRRPCRYCHIQVLLFEMRVQNNMPSISRQKERHKAEATRCKTTSWASSLKLEQLGTGPSLRPSAREPHLAICRQSKARFGLALTSKKIHWADSSRVRTSYNIVTTWRTEVVPNAICLSLLQLQLIDKLALSVTMKHCVTSNNVVCGLKNNVNRWELIECNYY